MKLPPPVINARGYSTKCGGCILDPEVTDAMQRAARSFYRIEDLQKAASEVIVRATGAEAGIVTSGAAAALTLGMAACITGVNPGRTPRLVEPRRGARPVPVVHLDVDEAVYGRDAHQTINALSAGDPIVCVFEGPARDGILAIHPDSLQPSDPAAIVRRLAEIQALPRSI